MASDTSGSDRPKKREGFGRPPKYRKEFCQDLIDYRAKGGTYSGFAGSIRTCSAVLYQWEKMHPDFLEAKKVAQNAFDEFMDKVGAAAMMGKIKGFNSTVWVFTRKNCSNWSDRVAVTSRESDGEESPELKGFKFLELKEDPSE